MKKEKQTELFRELVYRKVWIPCRKSANGAVTLELLMNEKQEQYVPAFFSRLSKLGNFTEEMLVQLDFPLLRHTLVELPETIRGIVIEPFDMNLSMDRNALMEFDAQTKGMSVTKAVHQGKVALSIPQNLPEGLKEAVRKFCRAEREVSRAWILLAKEEEDKEAHLLFVLDSKSNRVQLFPRLAEVIKPFMTPGQQFELIEKGPMIEESRFARALVYIKTVNLSI